jgi:hypothetical protein
MAKLDWQYVLIFIPFWRSTNHTKYGLCSIPLHVPFYDLSLSITHAMKGLVVPWLVGIILNFLISNLVSCINKLMYCRRLKGFNHHVIGCNWSVDHYEDWDGYGYSTIYLSNGRVLATAKSIYGNEILYAELPVAPGK